MNIFEQLEELERVEERRLIEVQLLKFYEPRDIMLSMTVDQFSQLGIVPATPITIDKEPHYILQLYYDTVQQMCVVTVQRILLSVY